MYTHTMRKGESFDLSRIQPISNVTRNKPDGGLWVSVDEDWERWCSVEEPEWLGEERYEIVLSDTARICSIKTQKDLDKLPQRISGILKEWAELFELTYINFEALAKEYDVIEVMAGSDRGLYQSLYGWDCDCAVIMNPSVISEVRKINAY